MAGGKKTWRGEFTPKNPSKYIGTKDIQFRSSWELKFMQFLDETPAIIGWSSESISIPYTNPLTGKQTVYVPDFLMIYEGPGGKKQAEMIEIKPAKENPLLEQKKRLSKRDQLSQVLNAAKWQAAAKFCAKRSIKFRVLTELDLFPQARRKK
ncbi:MAG: head completion protein [Oxalobacteraceae bacterium]|jgi:hypothetical protein|nr:MAG: head completion protein [Oxalobacteraceae bacterium]